MIWVLLHFKKSAKKTIGLAWLRHEIEKDWDGSFLIFFLAVSKPQQFSSFQGQKSPGLGSEPKWSSWMKMKSGFERGESENSADRWTERRKCSDRVNIHQRGRFGWAIFASSHILKHSGEEEKCTVEKSQTKRGNVLTVSIFISWKRREVGWHHLLVQCNSSAVG